MRQSHVLIFGVIIILTGCTGATPESGTSPQGTDPGTLTNSGQETSPTDRPAIEASQNTSNVFMISDGTLLVNKTHKSDRGVPSVGDCHSAGVDAMVAYLSQQIEDELNGISVSTSSDTGSMSLVIYRETTRGQDMTDTNHTPTIVSKPSVSYQRLNTVVPSEASITVTHEDGSVSCHGPITIQNVSAGLD
jgi:hypothetical protein